MKLLNKGGTRAPDPRGEGWCSHVLLISLMSSIQREFHSSAYDVTGFHLKCRPSLCTPCMTNRTQLASGCSGPGLPSAGGSGGLSAWALGCMPPGKAGHLLAACALHSDLLPTGVYQMCM